METTRPIRGVFFTDLDGTLFDTPSYCPSTEAMAALDRLRERSAAIVPVSSKTAAELDEYPEILEVSFLSLLEGGAVTVRPGHLPAVAGPGRSALLGLLAELRRLGFALRSLSEMSDAEIKGHTGLPVERIPAARRRLASEPFMMDELEIPRLAELKREVVRRGASIERGGCFWHLVPKGGGKGNAVRRVLEEVGFSLVSGAAGDAWHDLPMLEAVDHGYLLGDRLQAHEVPAGIHRIATPGPAGFVRAVDAYLKALG
jgi:mannosyl-3-phosphoglycerate phosphatase